MSTLRTDTLVNKDNDTDSIDVSDIESGSAKAWVSFTGEGTVTVNNDYNVNNIGDNGTGDYTINFSTNFENDEYAFAGTIGDNYGSGTSCGFIVPVGAANHLVGSCRVYTKTTSNTGGSAVNFANHAMIFFYGDI